MSEQSDISGRIDHLVGNNHDQSLRSFAEKCFQEGTSAAIAAYATTLADAMRKAREFIDGLTPCDESIKTPELGICACSDCQTYRQAQKVLAAIGGGK